MPEPENSPDPGPSEPSEVGTIRHLVRLMYRYDLTAIDLTRGELKIRLRRRGAEAAHHQPPAPAVPPPSTATIAIPAPPSTVLAPAPGPATAGTFILSPMVGTFYSASSPDAPPYVNVGSAVRPEMTVCVIEAMKVFTDIPAAIAGTIAEVLVKNGQAVEFDQPLFRVNPA